MISISGIMTQNVIYTTPDTPIYEALELLSRNKVSGIPVCDLDMNIVGILSEKDVLRILIDKNLHVKNRVSDYMTREVISFTEEDSAVDICKFFIRSHIRRVPIVRDGKLIGIISRRDICSLIQEAKSKISEFRYV